MRVCLLDYDQHCGERRSGLSCVLVRLICVSVRQVRCFRRASARTVTAIVPYYGYARQDRKTTARVPISASDVAMLLEAAGVDRMLSVDLHCGQIQGFFHHAPVDNLHAFVEHVPYITKEIVPLYGDNPIAIVSPDAGGVARAKMFMEAMTSMKVRGSAESVGFSVQGSLDLNQDARQGLGCRVCALNVGAKHAAARASRSRASPLKTMLLLSLPDIVPHALHPSPRTSKLKPGPRFQVPNISLAITIKHRVKAGEIEGMNIVGEIKGKHCIIVDDMIDTAGTLCKSAESLQDMGALSVCVIACARVSLRCLERAHDAIAIASLEDCSLACTRLTSGN